jgi:hypothetical protein
MDKPWTNHGQTMEEPPMNVLFIYDHFFLIYVGFSAKEIWNINGITRERNHRRDKSKHMGTG